MRSFVVITIITLSFIFVSCGKYEEGPLISLRTKTNRLTGDYILKAYYVNDEKLDLKNDLKIIEQKQIYNNDGTGYSIKSLIDNSINENFEWQFDEEKDFLMERIIINDTLIASWVEYKIVRLTNKDLWLRQDNLVEEIEYHFEKQ